MSHFPIPSPPLSAGVLGALLFLLGSFSPNGHSEDRPLSEKRAPANSAILFHDVHIFDGRSDQLSGPAHVLVSGNRIDVIDDALMALPDDNTLTRIDGAGRVLMPGLIDVHVHLFMETSSPQELLSAADDPESLFRKAEENATAMLLRGFTSVRDLAGPVFALKKSIDQRRVAGPRIWPSGAMISQTGGHADFRQVSELPRTPTSPLSPAEEIGIAAIADGVPEVLRRTREQLMKGASQIKVAAGGGVASDYDPLDVMQFTEAELQAAVDAAENWNTYVAAHVYTDRGIQQALKAGIKSIEHGQLLTEETARMIAAEGAWISLQPFLDDQDRNPYPEGSINRARQLLVSDGTDQAYRLAKQYDLKTAWGSDNLWSARGATRQGAKLAKLIRWYTPVEILQMATRANAELLALSGPRNPYPGKLGVVVEGALADLILVNGNPLEDIDLIADPENNFLVIMKDGVIYKNRLAD